jgi:ATP-binding cassette subfamily B protein
MRHAEGENIFINQAPRYVMEALGMALIAAFVLFLSRHGGVMEALPILALLALGAQRLLPLMQQLYGNWSVMVGSKAALVDVLNLLEQPLPINASLPEPAPLLLRESIRFEDVSFQYTSNSPWILKDVNLTINKGARVGIIGGTGSGKSTALDLLMSMLQPTLGRVMVDGRLIDPINQRSWQRNIAHVPQSIFLSDASISQNIAFGVPVELIDMERVRKAAQQAQLSDFIESSQEGYNTFIGERGVRLSGGQRQRIGIARALYKEASVLIFDEATSALDNETEQAVMRSIEGLSKELTLLIIAHRITTLSKCDFIVRINGGKTFLQ